jgi:hypothetical protein
MLPEMWMWKVGTGIEILIDRPLSPTLYHLVQLFLWCTRDAVHYEPNCAMHPDPSVSTVRVKLVEASDNLYVSDVAEEFLVMHVGGGRSTKRMSV